MIKLCIKSVAYPSKLISEASLIIGEFAKCQKRANLVPAHKKESKNLVKNYRSISLLPIFGKNYERVIFRDFFNYFHKRKLFTKCHCGFLPVDSLISQLLSIVHDNSSFDYVPTQVSEAFFWIFPKLLIKSGTICYCINQKYMA